jgi:hypothetical protein
MEDLLKEEDFIKKPVKPWKWFIMFYFINAVVFVSYFFISVNNNGPSEFSGTMMLCGIPLISAFTMIFAYKNYMLIPLKTASLSIILMMLIHWLYFIAINLIFNQDVTTEYTIIVIVLNVIMALLCIAIILPIIKRKQKKNNIRFKF